MITRITAGAFLTCGDKILLMHRGKHKKLGPGMWAGVGGHLELCDVTDPRAINVIDACYREIEEETGIPRTAIRGLALRYVAVRKVNNEIHHIYHHFGEVDTEISLPYCDEGILYWRNKCDILNLPMATIVKESLRHWVENPQSKGVYLVAVNSTDDAATISEL